MESFIRSLDKNPISLWEWMDQNLKYRNEDEEINFEEPVWYLKTPHEVYELRFGICHDFSFFVKHILDSMNIENDILYFTEFSDYYNVHGGLTHTTNWYKLDSKYYWFEHTWGFRKGIFGPYDSLDELKELISYTITVDYVFDGMVFSYIEDTDKSKFGMHNIEFDDSWYLDDGERIYY